MHNRIKSEACKSEWDTTAGEPAKPVPQSGTLCTSQNHIYFIKARFMPRSQNTRKSLYHFEWNNCSLLICTMSSRKISTSNFPSFPPFPLPPSPHSPIQPQEQSLMGSQIKTLWDTKHRNLWRPRHRHHF